MILSMVSLINAGTVSKMKVPFDRRSSNVCKNVHLCD